MRGKVSCEGQKSFFPMKSDECATQMQQVSGQKLVDEHYSA